MPYTAQISRKNPILFVFLIDQSSSMDDSNSDQIKLAQVVSDALNKIIASLVLRSAKNDSVRDYFHVSVIGYCGNNAEFLLVSDSKSSPRIKISELADNHLRVENRVKKVSDGAGGLVEFKTKFHVWIDPKANGATPMLEAFKKAKDVVMEFIDEFPNSFPPIVINLTDGEPSDWPGPGPIPTAVELMKTRTTDGNVLIFNCHMSALQSGVIRFPDSVETLMDQGAKNLFLASSVLPEVFHARAVEKGYKITSESRGYVYNAEMVDIIQFLDIGTRPEIMAIEHKSDAR